MFLHIVYSNQNLASCSPENPIKVEKTNVYVRRWVETSTGDPSIEKVHLMMYQKIIPPPPKKLRSKAKQIISNKSDLLCDVNTLHTFFALNSSFV